VSNAVAAGVGRCLSPSSPVSISAGAALDLNGSAQTVASLSGSGIVTNSVGRTATIILSNNVSTSTFNGKISDISSGNAVNVIKSGTATTILSGANTYHGTTTVNGGALLVNGTIGPGAVIVTNSTLGGNGMISAVLFVQSGGTLAPGGSIGTLTANSSVNLQPGSTTLMEISKTPQTNDQLIVAGALTYGGTLVVTNLGGTLAAGDSFQLFSAASSSGSFTSNSLPALDPPLAWNFNPTNGILSVIQTVSVTPTNIAWVNKGTNFVLSWPADHLGWRLQAQTNALGVGLGTDWADVPNSSETNSLNVPTDLNNGSVFYRLVYP